MGHEALMLNRPERRPMKILLALLASALLAGCAVVPAAPAPPVYYRYGATYYYYPRRYYYYSSPSYASPSYPIYARPAPLPPPPPPSSGPSPRTPAPPSPGQSEQPAPAVLLRPIYFDLDKSVITAEAEKTLRENLEWFRQNPGRKVMIQGNCDPRAPGEYNLVLGQRRADAAKKYLAGLGVDAALLATVSYGNERPSCEAKDESCWTKERRVDFQPMR